MIAQIQVRRGTTAEWAAASPVVLAAGDPPDPVTDWIDEANETFDALKAVEFSTNGKYLEVNI